MEKFSATNAIRKECAKEVRDREDSAEEIEADSAETEAEEDSKFRFYMQKKSRAIETFLLL